MSESEFTSTIGRVDALDLRSRLTFLRRFAWLIVGVVVVALVSAGWITSRQERTYETSSAVVLRTNQTAALFPFSSAGRFELLRVPETELLFVESETFRAFVQSATPPGVSVSTRIAGSSQLVFTASSPDPEAAASSADLWAESYVRMRNEIVLTENSSATEFLQSTIDDLEAERTEIRSDVIRLESLLDRTEDPDQYSRLLSQKVSMETQLQTRLSPVDQQIRDLTSQLATLDLLDRYLGDDEVSGRVERLAAIPVSPVSPNVTRNLITATLLGLALGAGLAYGLDSLNNRVTSAEDVSASTGLPVLATVPNYEVGASGPIETIADPTSLASERYRALVTSLEFASMKQPIASLLVTSPMPGDGKSTTALNIAALTSMHTSVLLIGADLRRPTLHRVLGADNGGGLSSILLEDADFDDVKTSVQHGERSFDVLPAGPIYGDPALLLRGDRWRTLLAKLEDRYELLVIDAPPVLPVTDALLLGRDASAQILVSRTGQTTLKDLGRAAELLRTNGSRLLGVTINGEKMKKSDYSYRYGDNNSE